MKQWSREELMKDLRELVTEINHLEKADDIDGKSGGIVTTSEDACNPSNEGLEESTEDFGIKSYSEDVLEDMK